MTIEIKGDNLRTNVFNPPHSGPDDPVAYQLKSLGKVSKKEQAGETCYQNAQIALCITPNEAPR